MRTETRDHKLDSPITSFNKTQELIYHLHEYDIDVKSNHVYLMGTEAYVQGAGDLWVPEPGIDYTIANKFIRNFNLLIRINPNKPILVHMKTNGGIWEEGMAIYDTIRSCPWPVTILNYTHARSMSSLIFQAANKRVMMPHSHLMFHDGNFGIEGTIKQVYSAVEFTKNADIEMLDIYANMMVKQGEFKGKAIDKIKKWLRAEMDKKEDVYLNVDQTIKYGLADEKFDYNWKKLTEYTKEQLER
jgi:ATP-dependent protease ClpP protease subunit